MPIVTQSREDLPIHAQGLLTVGNSGSFAPYTPFDWYRASRYETTTSFRSKAGHSEDLVDEDGFTGSLGTRAEFQEELSKSDREMGKPAYDTGHEFKSVKSTLELSSASRDFSFSRNSGHPFWGNTPVRYRGDVLPWASWNMAPNWPDPVEPSFNEINRDGARAINRTLPTKPHAGLMQFLGELREQFPQLIGHAIVQKSLGPRALGNEHLNVQFGWRPLIADLQKFALAVLAGNNLLRQYVRDSNRQVRRHTVLFEGTALTEKPPWNSGVNYVHADEGLPYSPEGFFMILPSATVTDTVTQRVWFSGAYAYLLADLSSWVRKAERFDQQANHLLGTRLTPSVLWELTPWSWMIDWFGNFSAVVQNADALTSDSLSLRYGYIMHHYEVRREVSIIGAYDFQGKRMPTITAYLTRSSKTRTRATPFGFGLDLSTLSPRQWAIVGALGGTKSPRSLRLDNPVQPRLKPQKGVKRLPRTPRKPRIRA
ncbi:TPA_asm: maturation protein [ssRNA phage Gerhypos.1_50]|uniref:Maturation protein n=2 Tax=Leviviricetes TaxID=2842243 RepID=A0A8S5L2L4_9VIRU|nr:maturation protein [ssRNA phage Gerhypos.1_50]QDH86733.1 MAG: hypothetical protein H1Bulk30668_000003 [Leviviridae sp.]DAD51639.1 TPA_asm: maturation protein [ssRNA phage Gerhypos.1_50]